MTGRLITSDTYMSPGVVSGFISVCKNCSELFVSARKYGCQSPTSAITEQDASQLYWGSAYFVLIQISVVCSLQRVFVFKQWGDWDTSFSRVYIPQRSKSQVLAHKWPSRMTPVRYWWQRDILCPRASLAFLCSLFSSCQATGSEVGRGVVEMGTWHTPPPAYLIDGASDYKSEMSSVEKMTSR